MNGMLLITRRSAGQTEIAYQYYAELGGKIPHSIANAIGWKQPAETMRKIRKQMERQEKSDG
jgi:hypothetical protein